MDTSLPVSVASCAFSFDSMAMFIAWPATASALPRFSREATGLPSGTAMITSAHSLRATSTGRLRTSMPSTYSRPSTSTGANAAGTAMLARIATARSPRSNTLMSPLSRSVATARNGIGSRSKFGVCRAPATILRNRPSICWVGTMPPGKTSLPSFTPSSKPLVKRKSSALRRTV